MGQYKDWTGERFGRAVVLERAENSACGRTRQRCKCDCGKIFVTDTQNLVKKHCQSCGCLKKELLGNAHRTHGLSKEAIYAVWCDMRHRCENPNHHEYKNYGGRGISVCEEWHKFEVFYAWAISSGYAKGLSIERKDVNGNYCPENCTWITMKEQGRNRRNVELYEGKTSVEWEVELGLPPHRLNAQKSIRKLSLGEVVEAYKHRGEKYYVFPVKHGEHNVVYDGKTQNEWARELGLSHSALSNYRKTHNCDLKAAVEYYQKARANKKRREACDA